MESLVDDVWLKIFSYLKWKELMKNRAVSRHWSELVLKQIHKDMACYINLVMFGVEVDCVENEPPKSRMTTNEVIFELPVNFIRTPQQLTELNEFLVTHDIRRLCIKWWRVEYQKMLQIAQYKNKNKNNLHRSLPCFRAYLDGWHPILENLCTVLRQVRHLCLFDCALELEVWQWLVEHCSLKSLHFHSSDLCGYSRSTFGDSNLPANLWPANVCISETPQATLTELTLNDTSIIEDYLKTVLDSLANVHNFKLVFKYNTIAQRKLVSFSRAIVFERSRLFENDDESDFAFDILISLLHLGLPSLGQLTLGPFDKLHKVTRKLLPFDRLGRVTLMSSMKYVSCITGKVRAALPEEGTTVLSTTEQSITFQVNNPTRIFHFQLVSDSIKAFCNNCNPN